MRCRSAMAEAPVKTTWILNGSGDEEIDDDLVELAYQYAVNQSYPEGCSDSRKRTIRRKAKKFAVIDGELFYKHKIKGRASQGFIKMNYKLNIS